MFSKRINLLLALVLFSGLVSAQKGRWQKDLSGEGWNLWLDRAAVWNRDEIFLPPVDLQKLPVNLPTCGWDQLHQVVLSKPVHVPGTVEEHYWGRIGGAIQDVGGDYVGVSWWSRKFNLDETLKGKKIRLYFQSVNLRAEVFVNGKLVGYDVVGNTPFDVDASGAVLFGHENFLDIRITDPVGNFAWDDNILMRWGKNLVPAVHGFGGITGNVVVKATDAVSVSDIYVQNQPNPTSVNILVSLSNSTGAPQKGELAVELHEVDKPGEVVWRKTLQVSVPDSSGSFKFSAKVAGAKLWELSGDKEMKAANLYVARVTYSNTDKSITDTENQRFGFRWFSVGEKEGDKRFYLNGKRVFMIAAMTRGFWPKNGIFPTPEMAKRDMNTLIDMGLNTMLMHRAIGQPLVMDYADKAGLFTYEEPGGYRVTANKLDSIEGPDEQALRWRSIKLNRMVLRDRSSPSMVIYNLKNEERNPPDDNDKNDMKMVHQIDPSRIVTYNSGSDLAIGKSYFTIKPDDPFELHILPFDPALKFGGWWDQHHWFAYSGYVDDMYRNPNFYLRGVINGPRAPQLTDSIYRLDKKKVLFFGEEGAFGTIIRLQKIKEEIENTGATGFREQEHLDWFNHYDRFLDQTGFRTSFPTVDSLTKSLGRNLHYFHGRNIENVRMSNIADAYNMNGWASASTRTDVVDMYRNPTADPAIIRHYTQPLYIAVKLRNKVVPVGTTPIVDFYIINEKNLKGLHTLAVEYKNEQGAVLFSKEYPVNIKGGEQFGQLLVENVQLPVIKQKGYFKLTANLNAAGSQKASGFDDVYAVDLLEDTPVNTECLVLEEDTVISNFLKITKAINTQPYNKDAPKAGLIIVGKNAPAKLTDAVIADLMLRVQDGARLVVLENADRFAIAVNSVLKNKPQFYSGGGILRLNGAGRLFVGQSSMLGGLPKSQGMSWEYQCFYKGPNMGGEARVAGMLMNNWGAELVVALGSQGSKEILTALTSVPVGAGTIVLSTLNLLPHLPTNEPSAVVAKKLFLNMLNNNHQVSLKPALTKKN